MELGSSFNASTASDLPLSKAEYIGVGVFLLISGVFGVSSNVVSVVMFVTENKFRSSVDILLLNLAIADIGMTGICFPFVVSSNVAQQWLYGDVGCTVYGFLGFVFGHASISTLSAVSLERYFIICKKLSSTFQNRRHFLVKVLTGIWMYAFVWAVMPLITGVNYKKEPFGTSCTVNWAGERIKDKIFITSLVVFIVILNVIVMIYCYINILMVTRAEMQRRPNRQENQVTQLCFLLVLVFLVCWLPYSIISLWATFGKAASIPTWLTVAPVMFAKLSSCLNPIIYIVVSSKFRQRYLALLKCPSKNRIKHSEVTFVTKEDRAEHSMMTEVPDMTDVGGKPTSQQLPDHTSRAVAVQKSPSLPCQI